MCVKRKNRYEPTGLNIINAHSCDKELLHGGDMTYILNPEIQKILSPVVLVFPDGMKLQYESGKAAVDAVFDRKYVISTMRAVNDIFELMLVEQETPNMNWSGEEPSTFF